MSRTFGWFVLPLALCAVPPAEAGLALPVAAVGAANAARATFRADRFELRLRKPPARIVPAMGAVAAHGVDAPVAVLGIRSVDALASRFGGILWEREFRGEDASTDRVSDLEAFFIAHLPAGADLEAALAAFRDLPEVASVAPIAVLPVAVLPNDSLFTESWWFYDAAGRHDIHTPEAWDITKGSASVPIAIIDTGVLMAHPDLGGVTLGSSGAIWTNVAEANGTAGVDDDGNGFTDDVHGWDFVDLPPGSTVTMGEDGFTEDNDPSDYAGHGTAVAGLATALTNNQIGVAGTTWLSPIMPLRASWSGPGAVLGAVDMSFVAKAIRYATRMGARVINCSFETVNTPGFVAVTDSAVAAGILICVAAGNGALQPAPPGSHDLADREDVLAVGSTGSTDAVANDSNRGDFVDLCAPGEGLSSTFLVRGPGGGPAEASYLINASGTSLASPIAAGVAALVIADRIATGAPPLSPMDLLLRLRDSATDIVAQNPGLEGYGDGRLNAVAALTQTRVSFARHAGAGTVGSPVVLQTTGLNRVIVWATRDSALLYMSPSGDTLRRVPLGAYVVGSPASARLADGLGPGVFVALNDATVAGFDGYGDVLPGWPVHLSIPVDPAGTGVSVGDIDGAAGNDVEIACVALSGGVYAWKIDGSLVNDSPTGFPVPSGGVRATSPPVLLPLDANPGAEIVFTNINGRVYAFDADGAAVPGWPKLAGGGATSPVAVWTGANPQPRIIVAFGTSIRAFNPDGTTAYTKPLGGNLGGFDPIAADIDGDGRDDILVALTAPDALAALDVDGDPLPGWPVTLNSTATGPPVARAAQAPLPWLAAVVVPTDRLRAFAYDGSVLTDYPKPGVPGPELTFASMGPLIGERVLTSPGLDSTFYFYMPPTNGGAALAGWLTDRANFARTGSNVVIPALGVVNNVPAAVTNLLIPFSSDTTITLAWTATGDDSLRGRPLEYEVRASEAPITTLAEFDAATLRRVVAATVDAGGTEHLVFTGLATGHTYWFALRARDAQGETSRLSNTVAGTTSVDPLASVRGVAVRTLTQPSRAPVTFVWRGRAGATGQTLSVYDVSGRVRHRVALGSAPNGQVVWNGVDGTGAPAESGIYFVQIRSGGAHGQTRVVLIR